MFMIFYVLNRWWIEPVLKFWKKCLTKPLLKTPGKKMQLLKKSCGKKTMFDPFFSPNIFKHPASRITKKMIKDGTCLRLFDIFDMFSWSPEVMAEKLPAAVLKRFQDCLISGDPTTEEDQKIIADTLYEWVPRSGTVWIAVINRLGNIKSRYIMKIMKYNEIVGNWNLMNLNILRTR